MTIATDALNGPIRPSSMKYRALAPRRHFLPIVKLLAILILRETLQQPPAMSQMGDRHTRPKVNLDDVTFLIGQT